MDVPLPKIRKAFSVQGLLSFRDILCPSKDKRTLLVFCLNGLYYLVTVSVGP